MSKNTFIAIILLSWAAMTATALYLHRKNQSVSKVISADKILMLTIYESGYVDGAINKERYAGKELMNTKVWQIDSAQMRKTIMSIPE